MPDPYKHRENMDGTWDSICLRCFLTAVKRKHATELKAAEALHSCPNDAYRQQMTRVIEFPRRLHL